MTDCAAAYQAASDIKVDDWYRSYEQRTRGEAAAGCTALKEACEALFYRFEHEHSFPAGWGEKLLLGGYR